MTAGLLALGALAARGYENRNATLIMLIAVGSLVVGFCEELATRGVLIVGFRARFTEPMGSCV